MAIIAIQVDAGLLYGANSCYMSGRRFDRATVSVRQRDDVGPIDSRPIARALAPRCFGFFVLFLFARMRVEDSKLQDQCLGSSCVKIRITLLPIDSQSKQVADKTTLTSVRTRGK